MRNILISSAVVIVPFTAGAQIETPQPSPKAVVTQIVGLTDVEIAYSRPGVRSRAVFGDLIPFGKLWRTGANENSVISFGDDVVIDGKTLKKGKYALYTVPRIESWDVIFYSKTDNWGLPQNWNDADVALKTTVKADALNKAVETFTIGINNLDSNFGTIDITWENSSVSIKFEVPTDKIASESIKKVMAGPSSNDYFAAAQYTFQTKGGDLNKSREYIDKALELSTNKPYHFYRLKSLIQAKQGDKKGAIETAKISLAASETAKNQDYVKLNKDSISEWSK